MDSQPNLKAPYPYFGGKSRAASLIWSRLGNVPNYVEPFFGSGAILLLRPDYDRFSHTETVNDKDCVGPQTRILKADMSWANAEDIQEGELLIGFDEFNGEAREGLRAPTRYRRMALTAVTGVKRLVKPCYRLTFSDGTSVVSSANHLWLGGSHKSGGRGWRWIKTESLVCNRKDQRSWILKVADVVEREDSYDTGWVGGFLDGEGSIKVSPGIRVSIAQNEGELLDKFKKLTAEKGFEFVQTGQRKAKILQLNGGKTATLNLLMRFTPRRLISNFVKKIDQVSLYGRDHRAVGLVSKEFLGNQEVIAIETECHTFIAEGLASHNCFLANFWRALQDNPEAVAKWADSPVNEADLHARHLWLINQADFQERMKADPHYYDAKIAGWWVWGICSWIGSGWCNGVVLRQRPHLGDTGQGVHRKTQGDIYDYFNALADRFRPVRVACGDWTRVLGESPTVKLGLTGIVLDPPYDFSLRCSDLYAVESDVSATTREWALKNGDNPLLRIALCGYADEHDMPESWECVEWKAGGGYDGQRKNGVNNNRKKERIWFSPHCLKPEIKQQLTLFAGVD